MDKRDTTLFLVLAAALIAVLSLTYYQTIVKTHFAAVEAEETVDPETE